MLDVSSTTKGALLPRMSSAQRTALTTSDGLTVYDTDTKSYWFVKGAVWTEMVSGAGGGSSPWTISGTNINNINTGNVGIGTVSPTSKLNVNGQLTIDQKNFGGYGGLLIKGDSPTNNYPNIGFSVKNQSGYDVVAGIIGGEITNNTDYDEAMNLQFMTYDPYNGTFIERMKIRADGYIGVGLNPSYKLHIGNAANSFRIEGPAVTGGIAMSIGGLGNVVIDKPGIVGGRLTIKENGNVGISEPNPGFLLNFPSTLGDKISLYGNTGAHYGLGVQGGTFQIHAGEATDDIAFGTGSSNAFAERFRFKGNGAFVVNGNSGITGQVLSSNGTVGAPSWINKSDIVSFTNIPQSPSLIASPIETQIGNNITITVTAPGNLVVWATTINNYVCTNPLAPCFYVYNANTYINGGLSKINTIQGFTQLVPPTFLTDQTFGPIVIPITSPGNHTLSFKIQSLTPNIIPLTIKLSGAAVFYPNY